MKKNILFFVMLLVLILGLLTTALAEGGSGDGSGGGTEIPLALASSTVSDGSTNVPCDVEIMLTFNKNVVNMAVKDNNMQCFKMVDASGSSVPIDVLMGDDQVDPTIKRIIDIKPKNVLVPGAQYKLTISANLTAKSGAVLGHAVTMSVTTADSTVSSSTAPPASVTTAPAATGPANPSAASTSKPSTSSIPSPSATSSAIPSEVPAKQTGSPSPEETASVNAEATAANASSTTASASSSSPADVTQADPSMASAAQGIILWLIAGGTTALLAIALFIARRVKNRKNH